MGGRRFRDKPRVVRVSYDPCPHEIYDDGSIRHRPDLPSRDDLAHRDLDEQLLLAAELDT